MQFWIIQNVSEKAMVVYRVKYKTEPTTTVEVFCDKVLKKNFNSLNYEIVKIRRQFICN